MNSKLGKYINDFVGKQHPTNLESFFEFKKSDIHGNGTFLTKNCPINISYCRKNDSNEIFYFNDIHFTKVLQKLGIDCNITNEKGEKTFFE